MNYSVKRPLTVDEKNKLSLFSEKLAHLLFHRGFTEADEAQKFVTPDYDAHIHDPFLLKDAEKAAQRIILAIKNNEKIAVYSDYDADGIPAAVIYHDFFKRIGYANFVIYIPHRHNEGFGLNIEAVEELAEKGVTLMITLDCGITDVEPVRRANELGIEVIITDHHEPPAALPPAFAIVDHRQVDCTYPDKNLCGSAVGFKLIQAILKIDRLGLKEGHEKWLLDMVGIATLSDMVPLMGENRVFSHFGLNVLRKTQRKGLTRLLDRLKIAKNTMTEDDIGFMVTPRINAASRMGAPMDAFNLLVAESDDEAETYAEHLEHINNERKGIVAALVKEVKKKVEDRYMGTMPAVIVMGNPEWRPSLMGLVANTCAETFDRPVFLWGRDGDNIIKGSCRSEGTSSVVEIMRGVPENVFIKYGGHHHSGGFEVSDEKIHHLDQYLNEAQQIMQEKGERRKENEDEKNTSETEVEENKNEIDLELKLDEVNENLYSQISQLAPFGMGNPKPIFLFRKVTPVSVRKFGKTNNHLEVTFKKSNGYKLPAISFFNAEAPWVANWKEGQSIDLVASVEKSYFRGRPEVRLRVVEVLLT